MSVFDYSKLLLRPLVLGAKWFLTVMQWPIVPKLRPPRYTANASCHLSKTRGLLVNFNSLVLHSSCFEYDILRVVYVSNVAVIPERRSHGFLNSRTPTCAPWKRKQRRDIASKRGDVA